MSIEELLREEEAFRRDGNALALTDLELGFGLVPALAPGRTDTGSGSAFTHTTRTVDEWVIPV